MNTKTHKTLIKNIINDGKTEDQLILENIQKNISKILLNYQNTNFSNNTVNAIINSLKQQLSKYETEIYNINNNICINMKLNPISFNYYHFDIKIN